MVFIVTKLLVLVVVDRWEMVYGRRQIQALAGEDISTNTYWESSKVLSFVCHRHARCRKVNSVVQYVTPVLLNLNWALMRVSQFHGF